MRSIFLLMILLLSVGCAKDSGTALESPTSKQKNQEEGIGNSQELKVYEGANFIVNIFQAANVSQGQTYFDFTYIPLQDERLALASVKSYLIGCQESDIGLGFDLFHSGPDGNIDFSSYDQLGPAPVFNGESGPTPILVKRGEKYLLRVVLTLQKNCLGLRYNFGVQKFR